MFAVTLQDLQKNNACVDGYNKLVCCIEQIPYVQTHKYIESNYSKPISLSYILESNGLSDAIWSLRCMDKKHTHDINILSVNIARLIEHKLKDRRTIDAINIAERYINGVSSEYVLTDARNALHATYLDSYDDITQIEEYIANTVVIYLINNLGTGSNVIENISAFMMYNSIYALHDDVINYQIKKLIIDLCDSAID